MLLSLSIFLPTVFLKGYERRHFVSFFCPVPSSNKRTIICLSNLYPDELEIWRTINPDRYPVSSINPANQNERKNYAPMSMRDIIIIRILSISLYNLDPRALLAWRPGTKSSGEPWNKIVSDWFQQKTIKLLSIGPFKFAREWVNVRRVWRVSAFSLQVLKYTRPADSWF